MSTSTMKLIDVCAGDPVGRTRAKGVHAAFDDLVKALEREHAARPHIEAFGDYVPAIRTMHALFCKLLAEQMSLTVACGG